MRIGVSLAIAVILVTAHGCGGGDGQGGASSTDPAAEQAAVSADLAQVLANPNSYPGKKLKSSVLLGQVQGQGPESTVQVSTPDEKSSTRMKIGGATVMAQIRSIKETAGPVKITYRVEGGDASSLGTLLGVER